MRKEGKSGLRAVKKAGEAVGTALFAADAVTDKSDQTRLFF
jgi:hypothetical protein